VLDPIDLKSEMGWQPLIKRTLVPIKHRSLVTVGGTLNDLRFALSFALAFAFATAGAGAQEPAQWPDDFVGRLKVLAIIEELDVALLSSRSATAALETWCAEHHIADPPRMSAIRLPNARERTGLDIRASLEVKSDERIKYRRVSLACGSHVLSQAENWYVPSRLPRQINALLDRTDTPFGRAVQPLHVMRQTLSAEQLWSPLPRDWERRSPSASPISRGRPMLAMPHALIRLRAVLYDANRRPVAEVVET